MERNLRVIRWLLLIPLGLAIAYLVVSPFSGSLRSLLVNPYSAYVHLGLLVLLPIVLGIASLRSMEHARTLRRLAVLSPCFLAPLAVFNAWTIAPGMFGGRAYYGYYYFSQAITNDPNLGVVNYQVLLWFTCVVISSYTPAIFAEMMTGRRPRGRGALMLLLIAVPAYGAVLVRLDWALVHSSLDRYFHPYVFAGAILRFAGTISMIAMVVLADYRSIWTTNRLPPGCCQRCGYDLRASPGAQCPECGEQIVRPVAVVAARVTDEGQ